MYCHAQGFSIQRRPDKVSVVWEKVSESVYAKTIIKGSKKQLLTSQSEKVMQRKKIAGFCEEEHQ